MADVPSYRDLEIERDPAFERHNRIAQQAGGAVMALLLVAAALGLFGSGLFSATSVGEKSGPLRLEYERFARVDSPLRLRVLLGPGAAREGKARLWLSSEYLERVQVRRIQPPPEAVELGPDGQTFTFAVGELAASAVVVFDLEPQQAGTLSGHARLEGAVPLAFRQFVYP